MKVYLLGLDGMTLKVLTPYMEKNLLPNFKKIIDGGASGILRSTIPPVTAPAWTSLATGKNPGKHHVFEFRKTKGYETTLITKSTSSAAEPIWRIISRHGKTVKILNIPLTYPPDEVKGVMVSGMMTPNTKTEFTFPKETKREILKLIPRYRMDIETREFLASGDTNVLLKEVFEITEDRRILMNYFLDGEPCDLFFIAFLGPDRIQHFMWDQVQAMNPDCVRYYRLLDDILGDILKRLDNDSVLFVASDHGFETINKTFGVNKFLEERGFLHIRRHRNFHQKPVKIHFEKVALFLFKFVARARILHLKKCLPPAFLTLLRNMFWSIISGKSNIDWERTRAFSFLLNCVSVNLKGRNPLGCVEPEDYDKLCEIIENELLEVKDPQTGRNIIKSVYRGDQLYPTQKQTENKPDLMFLPNSGYSINTDIKLDGVLTDANLGTVRAPGNHDMDGLFLAYGNAIKSTKINADIYDIMPTILYLLGLAIPEDVDGRVLSEVIKPEFTERNKILFEKARSDGSTGVQMSDEEEEELRRQLKGLGYIS
jgi:predicted AlkP superfamily phosphohydrolase/phosphomutase